MLEKTIICIDAGTTNTRAWLIGGDKILVRAEAMVGVRDSAREGSAAKLRATLKNLIAEVCRHSTEKPGGVIAAGMITSSLGLAEIPHIAAPAGIRELAAATLSFQFPEVAELPFLLVPGIRSGEAQGDCDSISEADVMRGEETLCVGLIEKKLAALPGAILNLGSHWKAIQIDKSGQIAFSRTSLSGELIYATQTQTILASAVPHERPENIDSEWADAGMREQQKSGLARALFCVRLLEQKCECTPNQRLSFLIGAFVAADFEGLSRQKILAPEKTVLLTGGGTIADYWEKILRRAGIGATIIRPDEVTAAFLSGLQAILSRSQYHLR